MFEVQAAVKMFESVEFGEGSKRVSVLVPEPDTPPVLPFLGQQDLIQKCLAAWLDGTSFLLEGPPGCGKNALVYALAREHYRRPLYILQGHADLEPAEIVYTARYTQSLDGRYVASPLVAGMLRGGIVFLDEIGALPERSLAVLASVLDERKSVDSVVAGFGLKAAHPDFRFCAAMNPTDPPLGKKIMTRLSPSFPVPYPSPADLSAILAARLSGTQSVLLEAFRAWMADNALQLAVAPRDAITMVRFARSLAAVAQRPCLTTQEAQELIEQSAEHVLVGR